MDSSSPASLDLVAYLRNLRSIDTIDGCRLRLLALRARIGSHWPESGGLLKRSLALPVETEKTISELLAAVPTPLPMSPGQDPEEIFPRDEKDLREVVGRVVDAALALLAAGSLDILYPGRVVILGGRQSEGRPAEGLTLEDPTIGLLVATIVGTLEAISESLGGDPRPNPPNPVFRAN